MSDDYETRRANAQGRDLLSAPGDVKLICMDISLSTEGFKVTDARLQNIKLDEHGVGIEFQIFQGKSWRQGMLSWLNVGADHASSSIDDYGDRGLQARVYCHESFRDANIAAIKQKFSQILLDRVERLHQMNDLLDADAAPTATRGPRP